MSDVAPGTFSSRSDHDGEHLVLKGANGETVVVSESHPDERGSIKSLEVIVRTVLVATNTVLMNLHLAAGDASGPATHEVPDLVERVVAELWEDYHL